MYYKILKSSMNHNGFQYKLGLNIDTNPFNPNGSCESGGLYYTDRNHIAKYIEYGELIAKITIPNDAKTYQDPSGNKWKADKIIIESIIPIEKFENGCLYLEAIKKFKIDIIFIPFHMRSYEICLESVKISSSALKLMPKFEEKELYEIYLQAVKHNGFAIYHIPENKLTDELYLEAVKKYGLALQFIPKHKQNEKICKEAIKQDIGASFYIL